MQFTNDELRRILDEHRQWLDDIQTGQRADLSGADLSGADLWRADLWRADLSDANLSDANLSDANLSDANLSNANLSNANLSNANLSNANLSNANLRNANLRGTALNDNLHKLLRRFVKECKALRTGGRIVYRTYQSQHIGDARYEPGYTYTAPHLSMSVETACHPGIYAASHEWMNQEYPETRLVRCYVRDGDWIISAKGAIRCKKLRVLSFVETP